MDHGTITYDLCNAEFVSLCLHRQSAHRKPFSPAIDRTHKFTQLEHPGPCLMSCYTDCLWS